jgi:hypothetical protein
MHFQQSTFFYSCYVSLSQSTKALLSVIVIIFICTFLKCFDSPLLHPLLILLAVNTNKDYCYRYVYYSLPTQLLVHFISRFNHLQTAIPDSRFNLKV